MGNMHTDELPESSATNNQVHIFIGQNHTGSWSFSNAIENAIPASRYFSLEAYTYLKDPNAMPSLHTEIDALREYFDGLDSPPAFIYSHRPVPVHLALDTAKNPPPSYITLLRNPVARFLSCYFWIAKHRHADVHWVSDEIKQGATLDEWVDILIRQRRWPPGLAPGEYLSHCWIASGLVPRCIEPDQAGVIRHVLDNYFSFIGITELFDESLYVFSKKMALSRLPKWRLLGNSDRPNEDQIDKTTLAKIESMMEIDMQIYQHYKEKFEAEFAGEIDFFRSHIGSLRGSHEVDRSPIL